MKRVFQTKRKTQSVIYAEFRIQFSIRRLRFYVEKTSNQTDKRPFNLSSLCNIYKGSMVQ